MINFKGYQKMTYDEINFYCREAEEILGLIKKIIETDEHIQIAIPMRYVAALQVYLIENYSSELHIDIPTQTIKIYGYKIGFKNE